MAEKSLSILILVLGKYNLRLDGVPFGVSGDVQYTFMNSESVLEYLAKHDEDSGTFSQFFLRSSGFFCHWSICFHQMDRLVNLGTEPLIQQADWSSLHVKGEFGFAIALHFSTLSHSSLWLTV